MSTKSICVNCDLTVTTPVPCETLHAGKPAQPPKFCESCGTPMVRYDTVNKEITFASLAWKKRNEHE